jgi:hypothetical protein
VRLIDLEPRWLSVAGRHGQSVAFRCPLHPHDPKDQVSVPFANPIDGGTPRTAQGWQRTGERFDTLTITPAINVVGKCVNGATWRGSITDGEVTNA